MEMALEISSKLRFITEYHDEKRSVGVSVAEIENYFLIQVYYKVGPQKVSWFSGITTSIELYYKTPISYR